MISYLCFSHTHTHTHTLSQVFTLHHPCGRNLCHVADWSWESSPTRRKRLNRFRRDASRKKQKREFRGAKAAASLTSRLNLGLHEEPASPPASPPPSPPPPPARPRANARLGAISCNTRYERWAGRVGLPPSHRMYSGKFQHRQLMEARVDSCGRVSDGVSLQEEAFSTPSPLLYEVHWSSAVF